MCRPCDGAQGERPAALGGENEGRIRILPAQLAEGSNLTAAQRMRRWLSVLGPDMQQQLGRIRPATAADRRDAQKMSVTILP